MKLKVINASDTPAACKRRIMLSHDEHGGWVREEWDMVFMLWSNIKGHKGDFVFDPRSKKRVEVDSPFEDELDEDGFPTGEHKIREGIIAFPVDMYEHSGTAWALSGEGGPAFQCRFDTTRAAFWLYTDKEHWDSMCGNCAWEFVDGKPTDTLLEEARKIARDEIELMNLSEAGAYYGYTEELRTHEHHMVTATDWRGGVTEDVREIDTWETGDSCWGFLTDKPAKDVDFAVGCPVVTEDAYLVGETFEQECWAFSDDISGNFLAYHDGKYTWTDDPEQALLWVNREYPESNRKHYEHSLKRALTVVNVTERIWNAYPECHAQ